MAVPSILHRAELLFVHGPGLSTFLTRVAGIPGVYVFEDPQGVIRVGESKDLAKRIKHHLRTAMGKVRDYPGYFDFFRAHLGARMSITTYRVDGGKQARRAVEAALIARQPVRWEEAKAQGAARRVRPGRREAPTGRESALTNPVPASSVERDARTSRLGPGEGRSLRQLRALLSAFPELVEEVDLKRNRVQFVLRGTQTRIVGQVSMRGHGYVPGDATSGMGVAVDDRGWARTRDLDDAPLMEAVRRAIGLRRG
jgi:predicted GIY-YIG superfamily endonuclease